MIVTLSALLLAGMQTEEPVRIEATWIGGQCGLRFEGKPLDAIGVESLAKDWARDGREVHIRASEAVPYRCIGGTIFAIQRAGVAKVGFVAAPTMVTVSVPAGPCRVLIDGALVTSEAYRQAARGWYRAEPAINFQLDPEARYECVDLALRVLKEEKVGNLGFTGNDQYAPDPPK